MSNIDFHSVLSRGHEVERRWVSGAKSIGRSVAHGKKLLPADLSLEQRTFCPTPDCAALVAIEIKERNLSFTCPEDFPYDTAIIDEVEGIKKTTAHPFAWVLVSRLTGRWVWVACTDRNESWTHEKLHDSERGFSAEFLLVPKTHLRKSSDLMKIIYPSSELALIDGDTSLFVDT